MDVRQLMDQASDTVTVRQVFGEPVVRDDLTLIPVAKVQGGGGGGQAEADTGETSSGGGFGINARPAGVFIIDADRVRWEPALDINRIVLGAQVVAVVALFTARSIIKARLEAQRPQKR